MRALITTCTPAASAAERSARTSSACSPAERNRLPSECTVSSMFSPTAPTPSLSLAIVRTLLIVCGERRSSSAISTLCFPDATSLRMRRSKGVMRSLSWS